MNRRSVDPAYNRGSMILKSNNDSADRNERGRSIIKIHERVIGLILGVMVSRKALCGSFDKRKGEKWSNLTK